MSIGGGAQVYKIVNILKKRVNFQTIHIFGLFCCENHNGVGVERFCRSVLMTSRICDFLEFSDGATRAVPGKTTKAAVGVYFGENDKRNISRVVEFKPADGFAEGAAVGIALEKVSFSQSIK